MRQKTMKDGRVIKLGDVVTFDNGQYCKIGKIISMTKALDGEEIEVTLMEPSGHKRIRSLIHDYEGGGLSVYPEGKSLTSRAWETWEAADKNNQP